MQPQCLFISTQQLIPEFFQKHPGNMIQAFIRLYLRKRRKRLHVYYIFFKIWGDLRFKKHTEAPSPPCVIAISACSYYGGSMFIFYTVLSCPPSSPVFLIHALHVYLLSCKIDGTESVGYEDDGYVGIVLLDVGEYSFLGLHIERRCCFVEQQYAAWA